MLATKTRNLVLLAIGLSALLGLLGAYAVASEPVAYIASMNFGIIFLYLLIPSVLILFIGSVVFALFGKGKYAAALFAGGLMLPTFFLGGLQGMRAAGWARYEAPGVNDMRPIDEETNGSVIVVFTQESTFQEQEDLSNKVIHPWKEGPGFTGETGVRASIGLGRIDGRTVQKILFSESATEVEKDKLRMGLQASSIVYKYFENATEAEVREKLSGANRK